MNLPGHAALLLSCVLFMGCPGELEVLPDQGASTPDLPQGDAIIVGGGKDTMVAQLPEGGVDLPGVGDNGAGPDLALPDLAPPPDQAVTNADKGPPTGGSCPCAAGLYCVNNACRAPCTVPTDPCKVISSCPAAEACVETNKTGLWVCIPANKAGQPCSNNYFCPQKYICATVGTGSATCLPVCSSPGATCGASSSGVCIKATNSTCMFCSAP